jgi:hypothetical protein
MRAMYVCCALTNASLPAIGRQFGGRDHTTVLNAKRKVAEWITESPEQRFLVNDLLAQFGGSAIRATVQAVRAETEALVA